MNSKRYFQVTVLIAIKLVDVKFVCRKYKRKKNKNKSAVKRFGCYYMILNHALNVNLREESENQSIYNAKVVIKYFVWSVCVFNKEFQTNFINKNGHV